MSNKTIALGSDHAGFELKNEMIVHLIEQGFELIDMGPD
ncbi:MAG: RpiB/LacA/LacB family sugar-phosphate isomerase, partial [Bacteroidota bacterium]